MTLEEYNSRKGRSYKMLLVFAMISIVMIFAGLTSAYVVSKSRPDWLTDFQLPNAFIISTLLMLTSSVTFILALKAIKKSKRNQTTLLLWTTLVLGILFVVFQFKGFKIYHSCSLLN